MTTSVWLDGNGCCWSHTEKLPKVVLDGCSRKNDAPWALEAEQCVHCFVPTGSLEPMPLIAHQQVAAASEGLCMLPCAFVREDEHLVHVAVLEVVDLLCGARVLARLYHQAPKPLHAQPQTRLVLPVSGQAAGTYHHAAPRHGLSLPRAVNVRRVHTMRPRTMGPCLSSVHVRLSTCSVLPSPMSSARMQPVCCPPRSPMTHWYRKTTPSRWWGRRWRHSRGSTTTATALGLVSCIVYVYDDASTNQRGWLHTLFTHTSSG